MAVLPAREKTIEVIIAIVEMCRKCSHFRLMLAVEETKIAQPETCEKYFVTKKTSSCYHHVGIHLSLHESCGNLTQSSAVVCLNSVFAYSFKKREDLIIRVFVEADFRERKEAISCRLAPFVNLVVYLRGHADACETFCSFRRSLF